MVIVLSPCSWRVKRCLTGPLVLTFSVKKRRTFPLLTKTYPQKFHFRNRQFRNTHPGKGELQRLSTSVRSTAGCGYSNVDFWQRMERCFPYRPFHLGTYIYSCSRVIENLRAYLFRSARRSWSSPGIGRFAKARSARTPILPPPLSPVLLHNKPGTVNKIIKTALLIKWVIKPDKTVYVFRWKSFWNVRANKSCVIPRA